MLSQPMLRRYRISLGFFIAGLVISGISAFPLVWATGFAADLFDPACCCCEPRTLLQNVHYGLVDTYSNYPWLGYGTDWLGFGHFVIALFFIDPLKRPEAARPALVCGVIACIAVIPFAVVAGAFREIPFVWTLVDCAFGVVGVIPLLYCLNLLGPNRSWRS